jgi:hypothetical protein
MSQVVDRLDSIQKVFPKIAELLKVLRNSINDAWDESAPNPISMVERQRAVEALDNLADAIGDIADSRGVGSKKPKS